MNPAQRVNVSPKTEPRERAEKAQPRRQITKFEGFKMSKHFVV
jgi:hypothetical protein